MSRPWFRNLRLKAAILSASGLLTLGIYGAIESGAPGAGLHAAASATPTPQSQRQVSGDDSNPGDSAGGQLVGPQALPQSRTSRGS